VHLQTHCCKVKDGHPHAHVNATLGFYAKLPSIIPLIQW